MMSAISVNHTAPSVTNGVRLMIRADQRLEPVSRTGNVDQECGGLIDFNDLEAAEASRDVSRRASAKIGDPKAGARTDPNSEREDDLASHARSSTRKQGEDEDVDAGVTVTDVSLAGDAIVADTRSPIARTPAAVGPLVTIYTPRRFTARISGDSETTCPRAETPLSCRAGSKNASRTGSTTTSPKNASLLQDDEAAEKTCATAYQGITQELAHILQVRKERSESKQKLRLQEHQETEGVLEGLGLSREGKEVATESTVKKMENDDDAAIQSAAHAGVGQRDVRKASKEQGSAQWSPLKPPRLQHSFDRQVTPELKRPLHSFDHSVTEPFAQKCSLPKPPRLQHSFDRLVTPELQGPQHSFDRSVTEPFAQKCSLPKPPRLQHSFDREVTPELQGPQHSFDRSVTEPFAQKWSLPKPPRLRRCFDREVTPEVPEPKHTFDRSVSEELAQKLSARLNRLGNNLQHPGILQKEPEVAHKDGNDEEAKQQTEETATLEGEEEAQQVKQVQVTKEEAQVVSTVQELNKVEDTLGNQDAEAKPEKEREPESEPSTPEDSRTIDEDPDQFDACGASAAGAKEEDLTASSHLGLSSLSTCAEQFGIAEESDEVCSTCTEEEEELTASSPAGTLQKPDSSGGVVPKLNLAGIAVGKLQKPDSSGGVVPKLNLAGIAVGKAVDGDADVVFNEDLRPTRDRLDRDQEATSSCDSRSWWPWGSPTCSQQSTPRSARDPWQSSLTSLREEEHRGRPRRNGFSEANFLEALLTSRDFAATQKREEVARPRRFSMGKTSAKEFLKALITPRGQPQADSAPPTPPPEKQRHFTWVTPTTTPRESDHVFEPDTLKSYLSNIIGLDNKLSSFLRSRNGQALQKDEIRHAEPGQETGKYFRWTGDNAQKTWPRCVTDPSSGTAAAPKPAAQGQLSKVSPRTHGDTAWSSESALTRQISDSSGTSEEPIEPKSPFHPTLRLRPRLGGLPGAAGMPPPAVKISDLGPADLGSPEATFPGAVGA